MDVFDWIFIGTGFSFFILMIIAFILMSGEKIKILKKLGIIFACLLVPLAVILIDYIVIGKEFKLILYVSLIIIYLVVESLLDMVLKIDFRSKPAIHVPYIILEYAACFSFVFGTILLDNTIGWVISGFFWAMLGALIYYFIVRWKHKKEKKTTKE